MARFISTAALAALVHSTLSLGQATTTNGACSSVQTPSYKAPVVGAGYVAQLVATGLKSPRGILFDQSGALLVVQQGSGIQHITFNDNGGTCLSVKESKTLISQSDLNHGIEISGDGKTLYASSSSNVYSWAYDAGAVTLNNRQTLVQNMSNNDHVTRTLLLSKKKSGILVVSRGSNENMDMLAQQVNSGHSTIRAYNISNLPDGKPYDYASGGDLIGWGLRNSVGVAEEPTTGNIFSVENSADNIERNGKDIHQDDPGEEMNFHGVLGSDDNKGGNFGYPDCFAVWSKDIPDLGNMTVGSQFALSQTDSLNDATCAQKYVAPRLTFQAHTAPLDIIFNPNGTEAYVSFHGSWNRDDPVGYKLSVISFKDGQPVDPPSSTTAARDILSNPDLSQCPGNCFRPVGLAMDSQGRVFMTSDSTGEIYVLQKTGDSASGSPTSSGTLITSTSKPNVGPRSARSHPGEGSLWLTFAAVALSLFGGMMFVAA